MTAETAIKAQILREVRDSIDDGDFEDIFVWPDTIEDSNALDLWSEIQEHEMWDWCQENVADFRISGKRISGDVSGVSQWSTGYSRHYEADRVAFQLSDGRWVGWIYWHGGGKHGEPQSIEWMEHAVFLEVTEEEKLVKVRTYSLKRASET